MITRNARVTGTYCNVPFVGTVTEDRRNSRTAHIEYTVRLDTPINVLGDDRNIVVVILNQKYLPCTIQLAS